LLNAHTRMRDDGGLLKLIENFTYSSDAKAITLNALTYFLETYPALF